MGMVGNPEGTGKGGMIPEGTVGMEDGKGGIGNDASGNNPASGPASATPPSRRGGAVVVVPVAVVGGM